MNATHEAYDFDDGNCLVKPFLQLSKSVKVGLMGLRGELVRTEEGRGDIYNYTLELKKEHVRVGKTVPSLYSLDRRRGSM